MVRYHLLLPETATRRDLQDPQTITDVVEALDGDPVLLELLHASWPRPTLVGHRPGCGATGSPC